MQVDLKEKERYSGGWRS